MYVLAQVLSACTDRDRDPLLMYELAAFPSSTRARIQVLEPVSKPVQ